MTTHTTRTLLSQSSIASIYKIHTKNETHILKESSDAKIVEIEAFMLNYLKKHGLNVPDIISMKDNLLTTQYIPAQSTLTTQHEEIIALQLSKLHQHTQETYGFEMNTTIGGYLQSNLTKKSWIDFFIEQRILSFAILAFEEGAIELDLLRRIESFTDKIPNYLYEPKQPSLLHGDVWNGNIIPTKESVYFIDPAIYYGHNEVELAFIKMFNTLGDVFYNTYDELNPIEKGFFEERVDIYNLYSYLVHVRAFGVSYMNGIERILKKFGF
ncbi:fructosamine kinase family protein [Candidatus Marinarcus aquaticus]|uniref:Fructosamine kinase n=1 Tax=Candidatus Marinarcus aquaticus TaxID=2044504 RepID=A0A4Q0XSY7_9BACT|nr:fructosamine kinase family protein [Candidatus Marinarcus aquaticus]RXJ59945.1 fructosamine kinase [Candidatus Marinarcus aquaticus]